MSPGARVRNSERSAVAAGFALLAAAILPPIAFLAGASLPTLADARAAVIALGGILLFMPGLTALAAARIGLRRLAKTLAARTGGDHALAFWQIVGALALFGYGFVLANRMPQDRSAAVCLAIAAAGLIAGWVVLLLVLLWPRTAAVLRHCAFAVDAALLSAFLHFGGGTGAAAYPLYLMLILYAGWRFGIGDLSVAAGFSLAGFLTVIAITDFWRGLPVLAAGQMAALAIVSLGAAALLRAVAGGREAESATATVRERALSAAAGALRQTLAVVPAAADDGAAGLSELHDQLQDVGDLVSAVAGTFAAPTEAFDLHALVNETMAGLRRDASEHPFRRGARIDPALPFQLRGQRRQLRRILSNLANLASSHGGRDAVRLTVDGRAAGERRLRLRLALRIAGIPPFAETAAFALLEQLAQLVGGEVAVREIGTGQREVCVLLPMTLDRSAPGMLDLADRAVLIVSDDSQFAGELAEPLNSWRADVRWIGGCEAALGHLARSEPRWPPILVVDGRTDPLAALSFAHRAAAGAASPFILFVAAQEQAEHISRLGDGAFDNLLVAPVSEALLGNALHALPLNEPPPPPARVDVGSTAGPVPAVQPVTERVTPITAHPRFAADPAEALDADIVASLRELGEADDFLNELVGEFREEARAIIERLGRAAAEADLAGFCAALGTLRRCAGNVGGVKLNQVALTLRRTTEDELREHGSEYVHRLVAELARLDAALNDALGGRQANRQ